KVLYSLVPLILIIFFSWLFSFMGSRMKKQTDRTDVSSTENDDDGRLIDFLTGHADDDLLMVPGGEGPERPKETVEVDSSDWRTYRDPRAPRVTPDPIRPKWWGA
ncbi:MAG: hypothetical protein P8182_08965, partial [Deltaproteobacteria bacterium]